MSRRPQREPSDALSSLKLQDGPDTLRIDRAGSTPITVLLEGFWIVPPVSLPPHHETLRELLAGDRAVSGVG